MGYYTRFDNEIERSGVEIITLPEELKNQYPKVMWVSSHEDFYVKYKRVVFAHKNNRYIAWNSAVTIEAAEKIIDTTAWFYAKDIEEEPQIVELTIEDISAGKGVGVPANLIRIKK